MSACFDPTDVPRVAKSTLSSLMAILIANGQGLALLNGLSEREIRDLEDNLWSAAPISSADRVAVALRFRALLDAFAARRLKEMLIERGFKVIAAAIAAAAEQRLNTRFGLNPQRLLLAIDAATQSVCLPTFEDAEFLNAA